MVGVFGMPQVINHYFGRSKDLVTPPVTALEHLEDSVVGLGWVVALGNRLMPMRVERFANDLLGLDAVLLKQQPQLLQRHLHTLMKLLRAGRCAGGQCPFEVVDCGEKLMDERFLLRRRTDIAFLAAPPLEILEIGGQLQVYIFLLG